MPPLTTQLIRDEIAEITDIIPDASKYMAEVGNIAASDPRWGVMPREFAGRAASASCIISALPGNSSTLMEFYLLHTVFLAGRRFGLLEASCGIDAIAAAVDLTKKEGNLPQ